MPKPLQHALIWSHEHQHYTLTRDGQPEQGFFPADPSAFARWLDEHTAFAFLGQAGRISVLKEARRGGTGYWYAYRTQHRHTSKRYLGRTETLSLARLEETARTLGHGSGATHAQDQGMVMLSSKLSPPRLPNALVERERLLICLDEALSTPLTLLAAPAGWGKTTLLATWTDRRKSQVAWLSLDELDDSPTHFWVALITALRRGAPACADLGQTAVALLQSPQPPELPAILSALLHELESREAHPAPIVLIVDDYQVIIDPTIHQSMAFFLERLPAWVHVILSSRVDPGLPPCSKPKRCGGF